MGRFTVRWVGGTWMVGDPPDATPIRTPLELEEWLEGQGVTRAHLDVEGGPALLQRFLHDLGPTDVET